MSYNTRLSGQFKLSPEVVLPGSAPQFTTVKLTHHTTPAYMNEGVYVPNSSRIVQIDAEAPEWVTTGMVLDDLRTILTILPEDVTFEGYLEGNGEEAGDLWRVYVVDRKPVAVAPKLIWEVPGAGTAS